MTNEQISDKDRAIYIEASNRNIASHMAMQSKGFQGLSKFVNACLEALRAGRLKL